MAERSAPGLSPLLAEDSNLWSAALAFNDPRDPGASHGRRSSQETPAVLLDEQDLVEDHLVAHGATESVNGHEPTTLDP